MNLITIRIPDKAASKITPLIQFLKSLDFIATVTHEDKQIDNDKDPDSYITKAMMTQAEKEIKEYKKNPNTGMDMGLFIKELEKEDEKL
jgi:sorbitol-specific phosphotransferase system component IIBC